MDSFESLRMSWRSVRGHQLRSALTALGVVIGVAAVITFVTLGVSLRADILGQMAGDQAPNVYVWAGPPAGSGGPGSGAQPVFTEYDVNNLRDLQGVETVIPRGAVLTSALTYRGDTVATNGVAATSPEYFSSGDIAIGRSFTPGKREVVINPLAARMFDENVSVGDNVTIELSNGQSVEVTVVGMLKRSSGLGPFEGFATQPRVYAPMNPFYGSTIQSPNSGTTQRVYPLVTVVAEDPQSVPEVQDRVSTYLNNSSDANTLKPNAYVFEVQTNEELLDQLREVLNTLTRFITGIAVISLIVGSIGIANIMLVSVTERTKEIGIMKAVGAQKRDVLQLFLTEAIILGVLGSVVGTGLGIVGGYVATTLLDLPLIFAFEWFGIAVVVGLAVGTFAGLYPAWSAMRVDPIDALRYE